MIEVRLEASHESLRNAVARLVALPIDEFDQQLSLRAGQFLQCGRILLAQSFFDFLEMCLARLLVGQRAQNLIGFDDGHLSEFRPGKHFFDVIDQTIVALALFFVFELHRRIFRERRENDVRNDAPFVVRASDLRHQRHLRFFQCGGFRGVTGSRLDLPTQGFATVTLGNGGRGEHEGEKQEEKNVLTHIYKECSINLWKKEYSKERVFSTYCFEHPKGAEGEWAEGNLSFGRQK